jgi:hypothetical protein
MSTLALSTEKITIDTVLPGDSSFQESLDHFVTECECRFDYIGGPTGDNNDDDWEWY